MNKYNLNLCFVILFFGCASVPKQIITNSSVGDAQLIVENGFNVTITTVTIDSCEYLVGNQKTGPNNGIKFVTHKGNCKFCEARKK